MSGLSVLYEDACMLVLDKPVGVHTAPLRAGEAGTLLQGVIDAFPEVGGLPGVKDIEPGLVHRIDRDTSGLVVVARTAEAFRILRSTFQAGAARKGYRAACSRAATGAGPLVIESRFAPLGKGRRMVRVVLGVGKESTRHTYRTEAEIVAGRDDRVLVRAVITRGFRHQVRAHLAFLGFPIIGDALYGGPVPRGAEQRMYLHAERLELPHPGTGALLVVESPAPPCFAALIEEDQNGVS